MRGEVLYLSRADVEKVGLPMAEIIAAVEGVFREKGHGRVEMPAKIGIHPAPDDFLHAMPAYVASPRSAGIKWVGNFLKNPARGLPTISGLLVLNDPETGFPMTVMDCTWITAQRTGAASAVAAKYLARGEAEVLAIIGCGVQGRSHTEAMLVQFPRIRRVVAFDSTAANLTRYRQEMQALHRVSVVPASGTEPAVREADIIVTATEIRKQPAPSIRPEWISTRSSPRERSGPWTCSTPMTWSRWNSIDPRDTSRPRRRSRGIWGRWCQARNRGGRVPPSGRWPCTWVWRSRTWWRRFGSTTGRWPRESARACRSESEQPSAVSDLRSAP
jgi:hypothetical protein